MLSEALNLLKVLISTPSMSREEEGQAGKILQVLKKGYLCDDKVLRHPMVVVGK